MIYMNGSDLESEFGAATTDLVEMLDSGLHSRNANVLILTGGAKRWMNDAIPEYEVLLWQLADGQLNEIKSMGNANMGNPETLKDFITFSMDNYPAEKYGLIMWDHGGGAIAGFGHDENFDDDYLSLLEMQKAFEESGLRHNKLEFLGFDACLMATVEMAIVASDYAHVMIAAEDLEPGDGWDYVFLNALNQNPQIDGFALGEIIVDTFMDFYGPDSDEILSLSVVDLSKVKPVMDAMGKLMAKANYDLQPPRNNSRRAAPAPGVFSDLATRRAETKTFGEGSPRDNYSDMVDIGDMALLLKDMYPRESGAVMRALKNCVTYNRHNSDIDIWGLSTFYIYGGKSQGEPSLQVYSGLEMDEHFTGYLHKFFDELTRTNRTRSATRHEREPIHTELVLWQPTPIDQNTLRMAGLLQTNAKDENLLWPQLCGHFVCLYPTAQTQAARQYAIPANVNGNEASIIVTFSEQHPQGKILGIRYQAGGVIQKGYDPLNPSDKVSLYSLERNTATNTETWHKSPELAITTPLELTWTPAPDGYELGYRYRDVYCEVWYCR